MPDSIGQFEQLILTAILSLRDDAYGVTIHQRVARDAMWLLRPGGWLVMEFGLGQERQLEHVISRSRGYQAVELFPDPSGAPRVIASPAPV